MARNNPREPVAASDTDASDSDEGEEGDAEALEGDDVYAVQDIVAKRRSGRPQVTQYLVHWKGYSPAQNTWEPPEHIPSQLIAEFNESCVGLEEETDNDDSDDEESEADEAPVQPARAAPAKGRGKRAAPPTRAPSAKRASTAAGSSSAAGARQAGKRKCAARPAPDSSDEEVAQ